jgi:hypothetical protein
MNKKRKYVPSEWSWTSKLYNASSLAKTATEQSEQVEMLTEKLATFSRASVEKNREYDLLKTKFVDLKGICNDYNTALCESKKLSASLLEENESLNACETVLKSDIAVLQTELLNESCEKNQIIDEKNELIVVVSVNNSRIVSLERELHSVKRECSDNRARKNMWKKKYEELALMGATALAKVTKESYGVSPVQFEAYKKIADTQFEVVRAEQERSEALKLLHADVSALEDKH